MKRLYVLLFGIILSATASAQSKSFDDFSKEFVKGYSALKLPELELSYVANLQHIGSATQIKQEVDFFNAIKSQLPKYNPLQLNASQQTDYRLIQYETGLNLQRLLLEQEWIKNPPATIPANGIITVPNGKQWYAYYLKRWVADEVTPDQIYQFGLTELKRVQGHIETVRKQTGLSEDAFYKHIAEPEFFTSDINELQKGFEHTKAVILIVRF